MDKNIHLIGNAHLDPIWLWRWQEGCAEVLATFRSALDRLNEYDGFVFTCSSCAYYKWVEQIDPAMFDEIAARVKEGRWVPVNGWFVQPDCNMPSGESFARQALYSQLYYYENFGRICRTGYNVDSFGHNMNLPKFIRDGGMDAYVMMRPEPQENPNIPLTYLWEADDGKKVLTYRIPTGYGSSGEKRLCEMMDEYDATVKKEGHSLMLFYGVGNHGGGPTRADIELLIKNMKREGFTDLKFSSPDQFFAELSLEGVDLPIWKDELQHHASGCYSATSLVKQLNRRLENSLYTSEAFALIANKTAKMADKTAQYREAWEDVCFNQFHDILCGCSIMEAYDDVRDSMGHARTISDRLLNEALLRVCGMIDTWIDGVSEPVTLMRGHENRAFPRPVVIFNPLSFPVKVPVRVLNASKKVTDCDGNEIPFQNIRSSRSNDSHKDTCFIAEIPALGYSVYSLSWWDKTDRDSAGESDVKAGEYYIENEYLRAEFSAENGCITSLVNKETGFDYAAENRPLAVPTVIDDHTTDTWAHNVFVFHDIKGEMKLDSIRLVETGPARALIRTKHVFGSSYFCQDFILGSGQKTLRVKCKANWSEQFTLLKTAFRIDGENISNTYEIPGGYIKRPANGEEEPLQRWASVSFDNNGRHSLCILNDSKYSADCTDGTLRQTLIRNVIFADHFSNRPYADFNFTDEGMNRFEYGIYLCGGEPETSDITKEAALFNCRPTVAATSFHKGPLPLKNSYIDINKDNIVMTALKLCEDGSGDTVMRFYETKGLETRVNIMCGMLDAGFRADFLPHEVKTFRIDSEGRASEVNFLEGIVKSEREDD